MKTPKPTPHLETAELDPDDLQSLKTQLDIGDFDYVDIASKRAWQAALAKWPLLEEWERWSQHCKKKK